MLFAIIFSIIFWVAVIMGIGWLIIRFLRRVSGGAKKDGAQSPSKAKKELFKSGADALMQFYMVLTVLFFGCALWAINTKLGSPLAIADVLLVATIAGFVLSYVYKVILLLPLAIIASASWWVYKFAEWSYISKVNSTAALVGGVLIALLLWVIGRSHEINPKYHRYATAYFVLGFISVVFNVFFLSTRSGLAILDDIGSDQIFKSWQIGVSLLVLIAGFVGTSIFALKKNVLWWVESLFLSVVAVLFVVLSFVGAGDIFDPASRSKYDYFDYISHSTLTGAGWIWAILFNGALVFLICGTVLLGYRRRERWLSSFGMVLAFLFIFVKYFDWFYGSLDRSIFFIVSGILLIGTGWGILWGKKRLAQSLPAPEIK